MTDPATRLERAQQELERGRPGRAAILLAGAFPQEMRDEADFLRAESFRAQGYFDRAAALYEALLGGAAQSDPGLAIDAGLGLASVHRSLGQVKPARARLAKAWALAKRRGEDLERFELEDALIDRAQGSWRACLAKLERMLRRARAEKDWAAAAFLLWATGGARRFSGDLAGGERDFHESLKLATRAGDDAGRAYALFGLGGVTRIRGRLVDSARHYSEARRRLAATDDVFGKAYAECGLANALRQQGKLDEAFRHYTKAHGLYSSLGDAVDLAYVDWGLGKIALQRGDLKEAVRRLTLAHDAFQAGGEHRGASLSKLAMSQALHALGMTAKAEALFDKGVAQSRRAGLHAHLESYT